jgi:hypothetical protein
MRKWIVDINQYAMHSDILLGRLSIAVFADTKEEVAQKVASDLNKVIQESLTLVPKLPIWFVSSAGARNRIQKITPVKGYF